MTDEKSGAAFNVGFAQAVSERSPDELVGRARGANNPIELAGGVETPYQISLGGLACA